MPRTQPLTHQDSPPGPAVTVLKDLAALPKLSLPELRNRYISLFGESPPFHTQAFLIKRIAHRLQETAYGGVSDAALLKMTALLQKHGLEKDGFPKKGGVFVQKGKNPHLLGLHPGTLLQREWSGVVHEVVVEEAGFLWNGQRYRSLSKVAEAITGTHWNGPRFFGLRTAKSKLGKGESK